MIRKKENTMKIEITEVETHKVVETIDCGDKPERQVRRVERGVNINLDHDSFYTALVE